MIYSHGDANPRPRKCAEFCALYWRGCFAGIFAACHGRFDGAQFADVADLFAFDGDLRMLVMAAAGLVEISLPRAKRRTAFCPRHKRIKRRRNGRFVVALLGKPHGLAPIANIYGMEKSPLSFFAPSDDCSQFLRASPPFVELAVS